MRRSEQTKVVHTEENYKMTEIKESILVNSNILSQIEQFSEALTRFDKS